MNLNKAIEKIKRPIVDKIAKQQEVADFILNKLNRCGHPEVILAGGAPRNWSFIRPARDLDIYVSYPFDASGLKNTLQIEGEVKTLVNAKDLEICDCNFGEKCSLCTYKRSTKSIQKVQEVTIKGEKVQFIIINKWFKNDLDFSKYIFKGFDFGICKIAWKAWKSIMSEDFINDKKNKTLTLKMGEISEFNNVDKIPERTEKILSYFPDFKVEKR